MTYISNCDSVFTANRSLMLLFVYVTFQGVCFGWIGDLPTLSQIVKMEINRMQVIQGFSAGGGAVIALFLYSIGGKFGEPTRPYRLVLVYIFCITITFSSFLQVFERFRTKKALAIEKEESHGGASFQLNEWSGRIMEKKRKTQSEGEGQAEGVVNIVGVLDPGFV